MTKGLPALLATRVLDVSESGFYAWRGRAASTRQLRHLWLTDRIRAVHLASHGTYGVRRVHAELGLGQGLAVSHGTVELLMSRAGLAGLPGRPKWRRARPELLSTDLVDRVFARDGHDQLWVTDITEHPTREGKVYCCVVLDVYSRRVVGWSIDTAPTAALVTNAALSMAIESRRPHPWRRDPLRSRSAVRLLGLHPASQGLRARPVQGVESIGDCYDNAVIESFWGVACRSSSSTGSGGAPASSLPTRSSSTSRSGTTASADTPGSDG
jgi:transposase InsO family protein